MKAYTKLWYLENFSIFEVLSEEEKEMMRKVAVMKNVPKHQVLYFSADSPDTIYLVKKGKVKISKISSQGKEIILAILNPGELFGELAITDQSQSREETAEVIEDAVICIFRTGDIKEMMTRNSRFNMKVLKFIGLRLKKVQSRLESLIFKSANERIISFIREFSDEHGRQILGDSNMREVKLNLTHADIARLTATSRQTVTTVLNSLEKKGIITYDRKRINIKDYHALVNF